jgi:hypothetical protein
MRIVKEPIDVNLFAEEAQQRAPRCNVVWWSPNINDYVPDDWEEYKNKPLYLNEPLVHTLKNPDSPQYSSIHMSLLKDLYRAHFNEEPPKGGGVSHKLIKSDRPIEYWQWDIFEQIQWKASRGVHPNEVKEDMQMLHVRRMDGEDIFNGGWNKREMQKAWKTVRYKVLEAYQGKCVLCHRSSREHEVMLHVDHIIPKTRNPHLALCFDNLQILCEECNEGKSNKFNTDWRPMVSNEIKIYDYLDYKPRVPSYTRETRERDILTTFGRG